MESLSTIMKQERRSKSNNKSSKTSLVMAFFSCLAWLYVAGRLWQDAENRLILADLLSKHLGQRPKVLTVEDKLSVLGCKDLAKRIAEVEMDLTLAKSQGHFKSKQKNGKKLLAVIGVYTGFGSRLNRNRFRGSWMPTVAWWKAYGCDVPDLTRFAIRVLGLTCTSSGCERNWSTFNNVHTKKRNKLNQSKCNALVYVMFNNRLTLKRKMRQIKVDRHTPDDVALERDGWESDNEWVVDRHEEESVEENEEEPPLVPPPPPHVEDPEPCPQWHYIIETEIDQQAIMADLEEEDNEDGGRKRKRKKGVHATSTPRGGGGSGHAISTPRGGGRSGHAITPTSVPRGGGGIGHATSSRGDALQKMEERGVVIRFVIGRSANRGDSLDRNIDEENRAMKDFFILDGHEEAEEELPKKVKFFFSAAVENWDAEFYVKVDDSINLNIDGLIEFLETRRDQSGLYMGCMKSGDVIAEEGKPWYEPNWWKFGDEKSYFRHAAGPLIVLSKNLAQYVHVNSASLQTYAFDDTSVGSWMMGIQATYIDENRFCCSSFRQDKICSLA